MAENYALCGMDTDKQPTLTKDEKCIGCGKKLKMDEEKKK